MNENQTTKWFTADPHLGHAKMLVGERAKYFDSIDAWNSHMLAEFEKCGENGELYILGDLSMEEPQKWRRKLPKSAYLIRGNHDGSVEKCKKAFGNRFSDTKEVKIGHSRAKCWLSHYGHAYWPASHRGSFHLYGHNHGMREETLDEILPGRKSMDVCPENVFRLLGEFRPISEFEVEELLIGRSGHDHVSFYREKRGDFKKPPRSRARKKSFWSFLR